jgi:alanine-synthesizing transaminase
MRMPAFSQRVPSRLEPNRLTAAVRALREAGGAFDDLTISNPTKVGLPYLTSLVAALADARGLVYDAQPLGRPQAREVVAGEYARHGATVGAEQVVLTSSTSEAYSLLFKVLCDPGDEVLVPRPGYPLFDHLARLDAVVARPYALEYHGAWAIDLDSVRAGFGPRTRALVVVSPGNPTGAFTKAAELDALRHLAAAHGVVLVSDEVFADYALQAPADAVATVLASGAAEGGPLTVALGGLSKSVGLPQHKLGWMVVSGPPRARAALLERLEYACDAYLSVATPVQVAAPRLLADGAVVRGAIRERIAANLATLARHVAATPACTLLPPEGGWSAVVRVPAVRPEEDLVLDLLERDRVLVHPGYFFDFRSEAYVVVSLLPPPQTFERAVDRLCQRAGGV